MPLIRAIGHFLQRRMDVPYASDAYGETIRAEWRSDLGGGMSSMSGGMAWFAVMLVALPAIVFLLLVGLIYEVVIRVTFHKLPHLSDWAFSLVAAVALVAAGVRWVLPQ